MSNPLILKEKNWAFRGGKPLRLPLPAGRGAAGGKVLSAYLAVLATLLASPSVQADARDQVRAAAESFQAARIAQQAQRQGWQGMQLRHEFEPPASAERQPACSQPLEVRALGDAASALERQQLEVRCADAPGWSLTLNGQSHVFLPVLHAVGVIERGQTIAETDLQLQRVNVVKARRGYYQRADQVVGQAARRRLRAGQLITPAVIEAALAVRRGQAVKIIASQDGIEASTAGEAMADGRPGEVIRVRNVGSGKVIDARVIEDGVVSSTF